MLFHLNFRGRRLDGRSRIKMLNVEARVGHWVGMLQMRDHENSGQFIYHPSIA